MICRLVHNCSHGFELIHGAAAEEGGRDIWAVDAEQVKLQLQMPPCRRYRDRALDEDSGGATADPIGDGQLRIYRDRGSSSRSRVRGVAVYDT